MTQKWPRESFEFWAKWDSQKQKTNPGPIAGEWAGM
jgi:hypothetical protein